MNAFDKGEKGLVRSVLKFAKLLRHKGYLIGISETKDALQVARLGMMPDRQAFKYSLKSIFCSTLSEAQQFDALFESYWNLPNKQLRGYRKIINPQGIRSEGARTLVLLGEGKRDGEALDSKNVSGANAAERLRRTDFSQVAQVESERLEEIAERLWMQMSRRMRRKMRASGKKSSIDLRRTIRRSISHGGEPIELSWRSKKPRKQRLVLLLDVSGSMDKYSFYLLKFICVLRTHFRQIEAFIFSTELIRITDYLNTPLLDKILRQLSAEVNNWSSGTRIGECFRNFNERYAKEVLNGRTTTIILSDGLDTGPPELLSQELLQMKRRTDRLIWLNPLKGMVGYEPTQRGMRAALPQIDVFQAAHNLDSLLELENFLSHV